MEGVKWGGGGGDEVGLGRWEGMESILGRGHAGCRLSKVGLSLAGRKQKGWSTVSGGKSAIKWKRKSARSWGQRGGGFKEFCFILCGGKLGDFKVGSG